MSFILVPKEGEDVQVNAWNWRATLELLLDAEVITEDDHKVMGMWCGAEVDQEKAERIADVIAGKLSGMNPGQRMLANLTVSSEPKNPAVFDPGINGAAIDTNELYSTTYEWLDSFAKFCRSSKSFKVMQRRLILNGRTRQHRRAMNRKLRIVTPMAFANSSPGFEQRENPGSGYE